MGSNMQRQAVPLLTPQAPIVGTGMEMTAGMNSGQAVVAEENGTVSYVDGERITVIYDSGRKDDLRIERFRKNKPGNLFPPETNL